MRHDEGYFAEMASHAIYFAYSTEARNNGADISASKAFHTMKSKCAIIRHFDDLSASSSEWRVAALHGDMKPA